MITDALEFGNTALGIIGAEERRKTLAGINKLRELWGPIETLAGKVSDGAGTMDDVAEIATQSAQLLDIAQRLAVEITSEYANPNAIRQTDAFAIDIAGRQRMLAQRISKNFCLASADLNAQDAQIELAQAAKDFQAALEALRSGAQTVGIMPPPTAEIGDGLNAVHANWQSVAPLVAGVASGNPADDAALSTVFNTGNQLTAGMNAIVGQYVAASKFGS